MVWVMCNLTPESKTSSRCQIYKFNSLQLLMPYSFFFCISRLSGDRGGTVVKVMCYKSEGRWFDPSWCHWNFSLT